MERLFIPPSSVNWERKEGETIRINRHGCFELHMSLTTFNPHAALSPQTLQYKLLDLPVHYVSKSSLEVSSWNMKNHMSFYIVLVTRWPQQTRNKKKSYLGNQKIQEKIGKIYPYLPRCTKSKNSAKVQRMLLLYFKFYFRAILKKTCKHSLFYICNLYTLSVVANCYLDT